MTHGRLLATLLCVGWITQVAAQSGTRSFPMTLFDGWSHDSDIPVITNGEPQPAGHSILLLPDWRAKDTTGQLVPLSSFGYDWSRIIAVYIDEPYKPPGSTFDNTLRNPNGTPACQVSMSSLNAAIAPVDSDLQTRAAQLQQAAPKTRFWVNFTVDEANWMATCSSPQTFNRTYIDVISADWYYVDFATIQPFYSVVAANPAKPEQQSALVPGTFFRSGKDSQQSQANHLQGFFDYANTQNQTCNLPLGARGSTGYFDGCRVWMVMGWLAGNVIDGDDYRGEEDPTSAAITGVWRTEQLVPTRADIARPLLLERGKMVQAFQPLLLNSAPPVLNK